MKSKTSGSVIGGLGLACVICCAGPIYALGTIVAASAATLLAVSETTAMFGILAAIAVLSLVPLYWLWKKKSAVAPSCSTAGAKKCRC